MKTLLLLLLLSVLQLPMSSGAGATPQPDEILRGSWSHYRKTFIRSGRVVRPENRYDTVSEAQAYGMLRAVVMRDRKTFDECFAWTESNLSRKESKGDRLLAWHYVNGAVEDTAAAADADLDYALSLLLAYKTWHEERYMESARGVLDSILSHETLRSKGRLYLLPWPASGESGTEPITQNPSYYSPLHFRLFYEATGDQRWQELLDTTYYLLSNIQHSFNRVKGSGLVPDWCSIESPGEIVPYADKGALYGWDAVRVPLRIAADYFVTGDRRAYDVLKKFSDVFELEMSDHGKLAPGYDYFRNHLGQFESPIFYSAAYAATAAVSSPAAPMVLERLHSFLIPDGDSYYYVNREDYYANSICWLAEYYLNNRNPLNP
ncbi:MAG: glycosyl hydrolase family 8 [Chlorobiaceae bacterium]